MNVSNNFLTGAGLSGSVLTAGAMSAKSSIHGTSSQCNLSPAPNLRWWLKQRRFRVTASLAERLKTLPRSEARNLAYIQNKVIQLSLESKNTGLWVNIGAKYFLDGIRGNYRHCINRLVSMGELEVNDTYSAGINGTRGFTKSYRIPQGAWGTGFAKVDY